MNNQSFLWPSSQKVMVEVDEVDQSKGYPVTQKDIPNLLVIVAGQLMRIADSLEERK